MSRTVHILVGDDEIKNAAAAAELLRTHGFAAEIAPNAPVIPGSTMAQLERYAILETLKSTNGSTSQAAEILGISTRTIQYRLHEYNGATVRKSRSAGRA